MFSKKQDSFKVIDEAIDISKNFKFDLFVSDNAV